MQPILKINLTTKQAEDCILGASISLTADTDGLTAAYGVFQAEALHVDPDYAPETINLDGWKATRLAWQTLFPLIVIIDCFLHTFLRIRDRCQKSYQDLYAEISQRVWDVYHAENPAAFSERIAQLALWAQVNVAGNTLEAIHKLCAKVELFQKTFLYPKAYRTSNMIDRQMLPLDRWLCSTRVFYGHLTSAEHRVRA